MSDSLKFTGMSLDRASANRKTSTWLQSKENDRKTVFIPIWRGQFFFEERKLITFSPIDIALLESQINQQVLLGLDNKQTAYFVVDLSNVSEKNILKLVQINDLHFIKKYDLRKATSMLSHEKSAILSYAKSIIYWHQCSLFCGSCGDKMLSHGAGHMRKCSNENCLKESFPRTDGVVIMLIEHQPKVGPAVCLLANHHGSPENLVSTLAGFIDPGESLEEAVIREVKEEVGLQVENIEYLASQPWPFPSSLMVGFFAQTTSAEITIDPAEISSAAWYNAEQIKQFNDWGDEVDGLQIPRSESIARYLIDSWVAKQCKSKK